MSRTELDLKRADFKYIARLLFWNRTRSRMIIKLEPFLPKLSL